MKSIEYQVLQNIHPSIYPFIHSFIYSVHPDWGASLLQDTTHTLIHILHTYEQFCIANPPRVCFWEVRENWEPEKKPMEKMQNSTLTVT